MKYFFLTLLLLGGGLIFTTTTNAATLAGWEHFQAEQLGRHNGECAADEAKRDFILRDYQNNVVSPQGLRMKTQVVARTESGRWEVVRETGWVSNTTISPAICYKPATESPRVVVEADGSAAYQSFQGAAWWGETAASRLAERGRYQRGSVHLEQKSNPTTLELVNPNNVFATSSNPTFVVKTNNLVSLYGASNLQRTFIGFWHNNVRTSRHSYVHGGVQGIRTFAPGRFVDGLHTWTAVQQLNGVADVKQALATFDTSCGVGKEMIDFALREVGGVTAINPRDITASVVVTQRVTGTVRQTIPFAPGSTISPTVCFTPAAENVGLRLTVGPTALYFNGGRENVSQTSQVVQNASGKQYFRFIAELPTRTGTPTAPIQPVFSAPESINTLKDLYTQRWKWIPGTGVSEVKQFLVDTTLPTVSSVVTAATSSAASEGIVRVTASDGGSGLRQVQIVFVPVGPGATATITVPFTVGTGLTGGPKETQVVTARVTLRPGTSYRYTVSAVDVAGNVRRTASELFRTASLTPDLGITQFIVSDTCMPEDVNLIPDAVCPETQTTLTIRNISSGVIDAGTNIPYRIEYRYPGNDSTPWTTIASGTYTRGLEALTNSAAITTSHPGLRGTGQLRALVNMAPQTNNSIGEQDFTTNTSPVRTIIFAAEPPEIELTSDRTVVRSGQTVTLSWRIRANYGVTCELRGGETVTSIRHEGGETTASVVSAPILNAQQFTLTCTGDGGGDPVTASVFVELIPSAEEV
jgi:hypothetical protein